MESYFTVPKKISNFGTYNDCEIIAHYSTLQHESETDNLYDIRLKNLAEEWTVCEFGKKDRDRANRLRAAIKKHKIYRYDGQFKLWLTNKKNRKLKEMKELENKDEPIKYKEVKQYVKIDLSNKLHEKDNQLLRYKNLYKSEKQNNKSKDKIIERLMKENQDLKKQLLAQNIEIQVIEEPVEVPQTFCKEIVNDIIDSIPEPKIEEPIIEEPKIEEPIIEEPIIEEPIIDVEITKPDLEKIQIIVEEHLDNYDTDKMEKEELEKVIDHIFDNIKTKLQSKIDYCYQNDLEDEYELWDELYVDVVKHGKETFRKYGFIILTDDPNESDESD